MENPITFKQLVRQPTGRSLLDSGDYYGRHWQSPLSQDGLTISKYERDNGTIDISASIALHSFLDAILEIDQDLTEKVMPLDKTEMVAFIEKEHDTNLRMSGYTYNDADYCDLDQNFVYFIFEDETVIISTHNGCDARGGFSDYVAGTPQGFCDSDNVLSYQVQWYCSEVVDLPPDNQLKLIPDNEIVIDEHQEDIEGGYFQTTKLIEFDPRDHVIADINGCVMECVPHAHGCEL